MELVERIARVIAGYRLSINAEGGIASAGDDVDDDWPKHQGEALAVLKALREPSPSMEESGMGKEWQVLVEREIAVANGADQ